MTTFFPREKFVSELDRHIIGQHDAKRAVAIALRNRWRRQQLDDSLRDEVMPKNILMIGPTASARTEISRRLAKLAGAPFIKVEATKFTEVGYVGRDVERSFVTWSRSASALCAKRSARKCRPRRIRAPRNACWMRLSAPPLRLPHVKHSARSCALASWTTRKSISKWQDAGSGMPGFEIPGMPGANIGVLNLSEMFGKAIGRPSTKKVRTTVSKSYGELIRDESDKLIDNEVIQREAVRAVENDGIVFLDEIDKIAARDGGLGAGVSREGVQRDCCRSSKARRFSNKYGPV